MSAVGTVLKGYIKNFYLVQRLAQFQIKMTSTNNYLGMAWGLLNPALQIMVYRFVFGMGICSDQPVHGIPFILWLLVGISMWLFINQDILEDTKSVSMKFNQAAKTNSPLSIIPTYTVASRLYGHIGLLALIVAACMGDDTVPSIHIVQLLIYIPLTFFFVASVALFTSTLRVIVHNTQMIIRALLGILFYMSPILWIPKDTGISSIINDIVKFNPVYFLVESYRAAILFHQWYFIERWRLLLYSVVIIIVFFVLGSILHRRYRDHFADFL